MRYFIISANPNVYNHKEAFKRRGFIDWYATGKEYEIKDIVYIYSTLTKGIIYKTQVLDNNITNEIIIDDIDLWRDKKNYKNGKKYVRLKLLLEVESENLKLKKLKEKFGFRPPQTGKIQIQNIEFIKYIESCFENNIKNETEEMVYPEVINDEKYYEGIGHKVFINKYERSKLAREECIKIYGNSCIICGFNFEKVYGEIGKNYIHIHHITPISKINKKYEINPKTDLVPICPNCHAMIHRKENSEVFSVNELKEIINKNK